MLMRKLIMAGAVAGAAAAMPVLYEKNPEAVEALLRGSTEPAADASKPPQLALARPSRGTGSEQLAGRRVRLVADGTGHFGADFRLNGRSVPGLVDTGATMVAINMSTAKRIGLKIGTADFNGTVDTANGRTRAAFIVIDRIEIGRVSVDGVEAVVLDDKALSGTLIGMTFMNRLRRYEVENGALLLEQ